MYIIHNTQIFRFHIHIPIYTIDDNIMNGKYLQINLLFFLGQEKSI